MPLVPQPQMHRPHGARNSLSGTRGQQVQTREDWREKMTAIFRCSAVSAVPTNAAHGRELNAYGGRGVLGAKEAKGANGRPRVTEPRSSCMLVDLIWCTITLPDLLFRCITVNGLDSLCIRIATAENAHCGMQCIPQDAARPGTPPLHSRLTPARPRPPRGSPTVHTPLLPSRFTGPPPHARPHL